MEQILLPNVIDFKEGTNQNIGEVIITPCHQGYGVTLGNALRRVLLSSLPGAAVESMKIGGVQHEFSTVEGIAEDVAEIMLNVKQIAVRSFSDEPVKLTLSKKTIGPITAGDFEKNADIEIANPELVIATSTSDSRTFEMEITIGKGRGYIPISEKDTKGFELGTIAVDSLYSPIRDIGYNVELTRVGDITDYEKLILTIETNGTITPKEALAQATKILMDYFGLVMNACGGKTEEVIAEEAPKKKKTTAKKK